MPSSAPCAQRSCFSVSGKGMPFMAFEAFPQEEQADFSTLFRHPQLIILAEKIFVQPLHFDNAATSDAHAEFHHQFG